MDNAKFINTYIDIMTGTLHEHMGSVLQLKTNLKVTQDLAEAQEIRIRELEKTLMETQQSKDSYINDLQGQLAEITNRCNELENKASHVDSFSKTVTDLKDMVKQRDATIAELQSKLPKAPINKIKDQPKKPDDDF